MWIIRSIAILATAILLALALRAAFGGGLWVWLLGAWLLSGPIVVIDAILRAHRSKERRGGRIGSQHKVP